MSKKNDIVNSRAPAVGLRRLVLRWGNDPPRAEGHYWYRHSDQHEPVVVVICYEDFGPNRDLFVRFGPGRDDVGFIQNYDGQWAGPIPLPENDKLSHEEGGKEQR